MAPRACDRCETLHLDNPASCRNCGFHLFCTVSEEELIEMFADIEACCECETIHIEHPHQCRHCEHQFFRSLTDSELLERLEEVLEAKRSPPSESQSDSRSLRQYLSNIFVTLRS